MNNKKIVIKDVAKKAGVSPATVSRVLNNVASVGKHYREKVLKAIKELGYKPNLLARSLRKGKSGIIGVLISNITNPFFSMVIKGIEDELKKENYSLILTNTYKDFDEETKMLETFLEKHVDGLIINDTGKYNPIVNEFINNNIPVVFLDRLYKKKGPIYIIVNDKKGFFELVEYLKSRDYRNFVFLNGDEKSNRGRLRKRMFFEAVKKFNIENYEIYSGAFSVEAGYEMAKNVDIKDNTVVMCANDVIAYGAISYFHENNIKIPDQIAVTGFDDINLSKNFCPPLTTVRKPQLELGRIAAQVLLKIINNKKYKKIIRLETNMILRKTTK